MHYAEQSDAGGEPVILLHGITDSQPQAAGKVGTACRSGRLNADYSGFRIQTSKFRQQVNLKPET